MNTFAELTAMRDLRAYEVVGTATAVAKLIRDCRLSATTAAHMLEMELERYREADYAVQTFKLETAGLEATIASTEKLVEEVLDAQQSQQSRADVFVMEKRNE